MTSITTTSNFQGRSQNLHRLQFVAFRFLICIFVCWMQSSSQAFCQQLELELKARQQVFLNNLTLLEKKLLVLSDFESERNQSRSDLLKKGLQLSQTKELLVRVREATRLIESGKSSELRKAIEIQKSVLSDLVSLYSLLESENPQKSAREKQAKVRKRIDLIEQIIRQQRSVRDIAQAESKTDIQQLKTMQENVKRQTSNVLEELNSELVENQKSTIEESSVEKMNSGDKDKQSESRNTDLEKDNQVGTSEQQGKSKSPDERIVKNLGDATQKMSDVDRELNAKKLAESRVKMEEAEEELGKAKEELENILRQEREEEVESTLRSLEERFKLMLQMQLELNSKTVALFEATKPESERAIESFGIASLQKKGMLEADKALLMLDEEGSSYAVAGTVRQIRSDMQRIKSQLEIAKVDSITLSLQKEVVGGLNDLVAALQAEQEENQKENQGATPDAGGASQQVEQRPLLQKIAELKIIRQVQVRLNARHKLYAKKLADDANPDVVNTISALTKELSERQKLLQEMTIKLNSETQETRSP